MSAQRTWVERDCCVTYAGRHYCAGGAVVTPNIVIAYYKRAGADSHVTDWRGNRLGAARIVATWATPRSFVSSTMHQIEATINGIVYTGRGAGDGMAWVGRPKAKQPGAKP